jgi:hypothetical protein
LGRGTTGLLKFAARPVYPRGAPLFGKCCKRVGELCTSLPQSATAAKALAVDKFCASPFEDAPQPFELCDRCLERFVVRVVVGNKTGAAQKLTAMGEPGMSGDAIEPRLECSRLLDTIEAYKAFDELIQVREKLGHSAVERRLSAEHLDRFGELSGKGQMKAARIPRHFSRRSDVRCSSDRIDEVELSKGNVEITAHDSDRRKFGQRLGAGEVATGDNPGEVVGVSRPLQRSVELAQ